MKLGETEDLTLSSSKEQEEFDWEAELSTSLTIFGRAGAFLHLALGNISGGIGNTLGD